MRWLVFSFLFLCGYCCTGQQYYETYTPANGLVDARVNKILQDSSGRLFFLTRDGLSIFDGQRFTNHTKLAGQPIGIVDDGIVFPNGDLQLATFNGKWINIKKESADPDTVHLDNIQEVSSIVPLGHKEWLIVSNFGLFIKKDNSISALKTADFLRQQKKPLENVAVSGNSILFNYDIGNKHMLYACNKTVGGLTDSLHGYLTYSTAVDKNGHIYVCTSSGIFLLNPALLKKGKIKFEDPGFKNSIPASFAVHALFFDKQSNIWLINRERGCYRLTSTTGELTYYSISDGLFTGTSSMFQDNENNIWFIANGKGVQKLVQTNYEIVSSFGKNQVEQVRQLGPADDGSLLFHSNKYLILFKKNTWNLYPVKNISQQFPSFYWQNDFWTYTSKKTITSNDNRKIDISIDPSQPDVLHFPSPHITIDKDDNILLGGNRFVMIRKDQSADSYSLPYFADNIAAGDNNYYYAFCRSNDIVKFSSANGRLEKKSSFVHQGLEARFAIHWNKDTFWIASRSNGIMIVKMNDASLSVIGQLTRQHGLSNDFVETLLKIDGNRVAAGTAAGLDIITLNGNDTIVENVSARINHFEPVVQLLRDDNGFVYARTENFQVFRYNPLLATSSSYKPGAWINKFLVNGNAVPLSNKRLSYSKNTLQFSISSPSFIDSRSTVFQFVLAGEKDQWQQTSSKADFEISNLPPGKYSLTVTVKYAGNIYPEKKIGYDFMITPPFWKTWWFRIILVLMILLSAGLLIRSYLHRQLERQKVIMEKELAIEQERTKMARELHDGLGSMLSGIKHSFAAIKNQVNLNEEQENKFNYNIGKLNESISELRDISHSMASESLLKYGLENSLQDYCRNISQPGGLSIGFETFETTKMKLSDEQSFHIFRIIQELLQNIMKHSAASNAIVQLSYNAKRLYITVEDNGRGFETVNPLVKKGMGLRNIESRVKILNGKIDYQTSASTGTSVLVEIPCAEKNQQEQQG